MRWNTARRFDERPLDTGSWPVALRRRPKGRDEPSPEARSRGGFVRLYRAGRKQASGGFIPREAEREERAFGGG